MNAMVDWLFSMASGLVLGLGLYLLTRVRGLLIPYSIHQVGEGARHWVWLGMLAAMVVWSNLALFGLRKGLIFMEPNRSTLKFELVFAAISFLLAMYLVTRRGCQSDCAPFPQKT